MTEQNNRRFGEVLTAAIADLQTLIRQEIDLAVAELKVSGKNALLGSILLFGALFVLSIAGLLVIISVALGIAELGVPLWLAFLLDALIFLIVALVMLLVAKSKAKKVKAPSVAADNLQRAVNEITETVTGSGN